MKLVYPTILTIVVRGEEMGSYFSKRLKSKRTQQCKPGFEHILLIPLSALITVTTHAVSKFKKRQNKQ